MDYTPPRPSDQDPASEQALLSPKPTTLIETEERSPTPSPHRNHRQLPLTFNLYSPTPFTPFASLCHIGPHRKEPLLALTNHVNSYSRIPHPVIILHGGLSQRDATIGSVTNGFVEGRDKWAARLDRWIIRVPEGGGKEAEEELTAVYSGAGWRQTVVLGFSVDVPADAPLVSELTGGADVSRSDPNDDIDERRKTSRVGFEWQEYSGPLTLGLGPIGPGWRLMAVRDQQQTVLAVCAEHKGSWSKYFKFAFRGPASNMGADSGECTYGRTWEIMAIMTGLAAWSRMGEIMDDKRA